MQISISNAIGGGGGAKGGGTPSFSNVNSFTFDGVDEYFDGVGTYSELDGQNKATFSFWIKPTYDAAKYGILFHIPRNTTSNNSQVLCFIDNRNRIRWSMNATSYYVYSNQNVINLNQWNHVLICIDLPSTDEGKIFINGIDQTGTDNLGDRTQFDTSSGGLMIAEEAQGYLNPFDGNIDELAIWAGTDQRANVSEIYNGGLPNDLNTLPTAPQPTTWHRMGENAVWNGSIWAMTDVNGGYISNSVSMLEANRTTDVPPNPSFANTKSILLDGMDDLVSFSQVTYTGEFTTSFWIKPVSLGNNRFLVGREANSDYVWLKTSSEIRVRINFSTYIFSEGSGNDINTGAWNHLLISRDSSNNVSLFLNGAPFSTSQVGAGNHRLDQIGKVGANYYDGNVDETAFWDSDQSSNLATIYNSGVPNDISSLSPTLWYRMGDGDTAPTLTDNGSGGNDGTMVFFNTFSTDVPT